MWVGWLDWFCCLVILGRGNWVIVFGIALFIGYTHIHIYTYTEEIIIAHIMTI